MSIEDKWKEFTGGHKTDEKFIVEKGTVEKVVEELLNNLSGEKLNFRTKIEKSGVKYNPYYSIPTKYEEITRGFYNEILVHEAQYRNMIPKLTKEFINSLKKESFYLELGRGVNMEIFSINHQKDENVFEVTVPYNNFTALKQAVWTKGKILHDLTGIVKILQDYSNKGENRNNKNERGYTPKNAQ